MTKKNWTKSRKKSNKRALDAAMIALARQIRREEEAAQPQENADDKDN